MAAPPSQNEWQQMLERAYRAEDERDQLRAEVKRLRGRVKVFGTALQIVANDRESGDYAKQVSTDVLRSSPSEGEARPAAQTVCAHCGLAEGHSRRCSVTKLGVDESRMTATPVPQGPSEAMPVALVDNLPEVPPDAVRCPESTAIGRCVLVSDHTDLHRIVVTWGRRRATPSSGDGGQDKP
jgi:hypothetical protein